MIWNMMRLHNQISSLHQAEKLTFAAHFDDLILQWCWHARLSNKNHPFIKNLWKETQKGLWVTYINHNFDSSIFSLYLISIRACEMIPEWVIASIVIAWCLSFDFFIGACKLCMLSITSEIFSIGGCMLIINGLYKQMTWWIITLTWVLTAFCLLVFLRYRCLLKHIFDPYDICHDNEKLYNSIHISDFFISMKTEFKK